MRTCLIINNLKIALCVLFLCLAGTRAELYAQAKLADEAYKKEALQPSRIDKTNWSKITKGKQYVAKPPKELPNPDFPTIDMPNINLDMDPSGLAIFGKILMWSLIIGILIFVVIRVLTLGWARNRRIVKGGEYDLETIENQLMETDLDKALRAALEQQDYRAAIRIYFLSMVKELASRERIHWKKDKTNGAYLAELYQTALYEPFRRMVYAFEYAWYGGREVRAEQYKSVQPEFDRFLQEVKKS